ncbi:hypothetical protein Pmar_PMAR022544, partial [Perkinsus marinus ATCC 50983]
GSAAIASGLWASGGVGGNSFVGGLLSSFLMIICAELGDKTFFIAAILSMRHSPVVILMGAMMAMFTMTVLSAGLGLLLPALLSKKVTHYSCIVLFVYFGTLILYCCSRKKNEEQEKNVAEQQQAEIEAGEASTSSNVKVSGSISGGGIFPLQADNTTASPWYSAENRAVLVQSFVMSFLAEWGDRSQVATIALASSKSPYGVVLGCVLGHCICTGIAVVGGRLLASKISQRQVAVAGGVLFLIFALSSLLLGVDVSADAGRQVVCTFATVGAARSALRSSKLASDGNRKCMRILRSFGGPISFEAHKEEEEEEVTESDASGAGKESNTTVLDSSGGEETTTAVEDDSSMGSSSPRVDEVGLLAIPDPPATLSWYNVPPIYTAEKLMRFFLDYGLHMGPLSPYRSCDVITDEHTSVALVHCASMQKARALQQALYEFPGLVGDHGSMKVTEGRRDTFFIDALPVCWGADASRTVVALNVPVNLSREKLIEIMAKFGDVSQVVVRSYLSCGRVTTYGLCRFVSRGSASFAAEISRIPITQQDCGYRTMLALLGQKARLKSLTWLMSNEWYFDMNRRRQQAWATTPLGYYYYPPMLPPSTTTMVEVPSVPLPPMEDAENEDGIWYERRPRFEKINDEVGKASTDSPPTDECLASNGVLRPLVFPPPQWRGGGYRKGSACGKESNAYGGVGEQSLPA